MQPPKSPRPRGLRSIWNRRSDLLVLKEVFLGPNFFSKSLMMCIVPFVIARLCTCWLYSDFYWHPQVVSMRYKAGNRTWIICPTGFVKMNLFLIWREENQRWCCLVSVNGWVCFKAVKSSSQSIILPSTPLQVISTQGRSYLYANTQLRTWK